MDLDPLVSRCMNYKVGDEVLVKARITSVFTTAYTADCSCYNFYLKNEDILQEPQMTAEEAWEIAKRICTSDYDLEGRNIYGNSLLRKPKQKSKRGKRIKRLRLGTK